MTVTHETAGRTFEVPRQRTQRDSLGRVRLSRRAVVATLLTALLGAFAYGIFAIVGGGATTGNGGELQRATVDAAHLKAQAQAYGAGAPTAPNSPSASAVAAYGERWAALGATFAPDAGAIEAYGERWAALGEQFTGRTMEPAAIEAYGARWAALENLYPSS